MPYDRMKDPYRGKMEEVNDQPKTMVLSTLGVVLTPYAKAIVVFTSDGNNTSVTFDDANNNTITLASVPNGWVSPCMVSKVTAVGATGTVYNLLGGL